MVKAVQDQIVPPPLEIKLNCRRTKAPPQAGRKTPAHPKPCGRRGPNISLSSQLGRTWGKELQPGPGTQSRLFPGTAWTHQQTGRAQAQALACNHLSGMLPAWSLAWPRPGQPVLLQAMPGHSLRASRGQRLPRLGRQAAGHSPKHTSWQGGQRTVLALYWAAIYLYRHSHWAWNINSCI